MGRGALEWLPCDNTSLSTSLIANRAFSIENKHLQTHPLQAAHTLRWQQAAKQDRKAVRSSKCRQNSQNPQPLPSKADGFRRNYGKTVPYMLIWTIINAWKSKKKKKLPPECKADEAASSRSICSSAPSVKWITTWKRNKFLSGPIIFQV